MGLIGGCTAASELGTSFSRVLAFRVEDKFPISQVRLASGGYLASRDIASGSAATTFRSGNLVFSLVSRRHRLPAIRAVIGQHWERQRQDCLAELQDDFALAVWDDERAELCLARSPLGSFGLYYRITGNQTVFATIAAALSKDCPPNLAYLVDHQRPRGLVGKPMTAFRGVYAVESGTVVKVVAGEASICRYWTPEPHGKEWGDKAGRLRAALEEAVDDALEGAIRPAAHLSSGRDSAAVAATCALQLRESGDTLIAFTAVPNPDTHRPSGPLVADEGPTAGKVAALHPNIDHRLVVTANFALGAALDRVNALLPGPHGTPVNLPWWISIIEQAAALGSNVILTGAAGNLSISAGGPWAIRDLLSIGDLSDWAGAFIEAAKVPQTSLLSLLDANLGPFLPAGVYKAVKRLSGKAPHVWGRFLTGELASQVRGVSDADMRQPLLWRDVRCQMLADWNFSDPTSELLFGVSLRDPTAARDVVDVSLTLSPRELATPYDQRPVYEAAFNDRLPIEVLRKGARGLQAADWATMIDPCELRERFEVYARSAAVAEYVDVAAVRQALARWPAADQPCPEWEVFTLELLPAISLASFLHLHWPG